jgi:triacylglycerol lipase
LPLASRFDAPSLARHVFQSGEFSMGLDAKNTKHSFHNALVLAKASQIAYDANDIVKKGIAKIVGHPLDKIKFIEHKATNTELFMASFDDCIIISFRGTQSIADWLQDGQIALVPFRTMGLVHFGFRTAVENVFDEITATLQAWAGKGRTVWITGHSLGGALALMTAACLRFPVDPSKTLAQPIAGLYTFGQPRVGTSSFCGACEGDFGNLYFRYVNNQDIVTRVPPRLPLPYRHTGQIKFIDNDQIIHDDEAFWQTFLDLVPVGELKKEELKAKKAQISTISDHAIAKYIAAIEKNLPLIVA